MRNKNSATNMMLIVISVLFGFFSGVAMVELDRETLLNTCPPESFCYEPYGEPVQPEYVLGGTLVVVRWKAPEDMPTDTEAYASWEVYYDRNVSFCLITATPPQQVLGDPRMDALGHELLHCLTGEFHP